MSLAIVEIFYSLQGEGLYSGEPSLFIRLGGCNLRCSGFENRCLSPLDNSFIYGCDTIRAVSHHFKSTWEYLSSDEMIERIQDCLRPYSFKPHIVITGGEPLLHCDNPDFVNLCHYLVSCHYAITIETNATIMPDFTTYPFFSTFTYALSVKLSSSGEELTKRYKPNVLKEITTHAQCFYKFVIRGIESEYDEILSITSENFAPIWCMPLASTHEELTYYANQVWNFCLRYGFRYSDRLHIRLFNTQEGV